MSDFMLSQMDDAERAGLDYSLLPEPPASKLGRCDGCGSHRTVYQHGDDWLCRGPNKCLKRAGAGRLTRRK